MKTRMKTFGTIASLCALLGIGALAPVHADDFNDARNAVRHDLINIRNDQARIKALVHKKNDQLRHRDFRNAHGTDQRIDYAKLDLKRDRGLLHTDQRALARLHR